jgi:membrane protease YdiL (CAAX protease family)
LLFGLAIPIWLISSFVGVIGSLKIPVTDLLLAFTPLIAAVILIYRDEGAAGVRTLLFTAFGVRGAGAKRWLVIAILLPLLIYVSTYAVIRSTGLGPAAELHVVRLPLLAVIFFLLAVGEEGGWMGYAIDPMQERWGAVGAAVLLSIPWWLGHLPSILEIGGTLTDIAWWLSGAVGLRILILWLYNNAGKGLFAAVLFHAVLNVGRSAFYPTIGTHYHPAYQAVTYSIALVLGMIVAILWGPKTLTRARRTAPSFSLDQ